LDGAAPGAAPYPPPGPLLSAEDLREIVEYGFDAVDETLAAHLETAWFRVTGDRSFAEEQSKAHTASPKQREAISLFAGLVAAKYQASLLYLPEFCLAVAVTGYASSWLVAFSAVRRAAQSAREQRERARQGPSPVPPSAAAPAPTS
jgi:hypothetical protein